MADAVGAAHANTKAVPGQDPKLSDRLNTNIVLLEASHARDVLTILVKVWREDHPGFVAPRNDERHGDCFWHVAIP